MEKYANRFSLPNEVIILKLSAQALAIYTYLLYCCDRKTYKCYPSYATIGEAQKKLEEYDRKHPRASA